MTCPDLYCSISFHFSNMILNDFRFFELYLNVSKSYDCIGPGFTLYCKHEFV